MGLCCTCKEEESQVVDPRCSSCRNKQYKKYHKKKQKEYHDYISNLGCICCGESHPSCLEVHHLNPIQDKRRDRIRNRHRNKKDLDAEIAIVLCGNCHNLFHSYWGGKAAEFPEQTEESTITIIQFERDKFGG